MADFRHAASIIAGISLMDSSESAESDSTFSGPEVPAYPPSDCAGKLCATRSTAKRKGCICRDGDRKCSSHCRCGRQGQPCKNKVVIPNPRPHMVTNESVNKDQEDKQENLLVDNYVETLPIEKLKKLVYVKYKCGAGSMEFIQSILKDDAQHEESYIEPTNPNLPQWCKCGKCKEMQRAIENKCCQKADCITSKRKFGKFCLDPENLEMAIKNITDIRNDSRDNSTRAFRKAAYRQFVLWQHGYLGKGNRKVVPSCAVLCIRNKYPSPTGIYMGFKEQ